MGVYLPFLAQALLLSDRAMQFDSNDLANSQTPAFAAQTLSFGAQLAQQWQAQSATGGSGSVVTEPGSISPDGSSVDPTAIMTNLTENETVYSLAAQAWQMQQTTIQTVANTTTP